MDFDVSFFPPDPPGGGFDNNGGALSMSPVQLETYLSAAQQILDRALVEGPRPQSFTWKFTPKIGPVDRTRVRVDPKNDPIVNGGVPGAGNIPDGDWIVIRNFQWSTSVGARDFRMPITGDYVIRVKAAGRVPSRSEVVASAEKILAARRDEEDEEPDLAAAGNKAKYERDLDHFKTDRMYDYGPPRLKAGSATRFATPHPGRIRCGRHQGEAEGSHVHRSVHDRDCRHQL